MITVGADPGASTGIAVAQGKRLVGAKLIKSPHGENPARRWWDLACLAADYFTGWGKIGHFAVEFPQVYSAGKGKGDPNDLFPVAGIAQSLAIEAMREGAEVTLYKPREWKGTIDKLVNTYRVRQRLSPEEFSYIVIPPNTCSRCSMQTPSEPSCEKKTPCEVHNVYDGVGVLLKALGRFERFRVIPR